MELGQEYVVAIHPAGKMRVTKVYDSFMGMWKYRIQRKRKFLWWGWWENTGDHGFGYRYLHDWCVRYDFEEVEEGG